MKETRVVYVSTCVDDSPGGFGELHYEWNKVTEERIPDEERTWYHRLFGIKWKTIKTEKL